MKALDTQTCGIRAIRKMVKSLHKLWVIWLSGFKCKRLDFSSQGLCSWSLCSCWVQILQFYTNENATFQEFRWSTLWTYFHWRAFLAQVSWFWWNLISAEIQLEERQMLLHRRMILITSTAVALTMLNKRWRNKWKFIGKCPCVARARNEWLLGADCKQGLHRVTVDLTFQNDRFNV